jgi:flagellar basal-body rod protein FlgG
MERALWSAVTGMKAQEMSLDTIANNLANINTTSFKSSKVSFQDMLYSALASPGATNSNGEIPVGIQIGHGVRVSGISKSFRQGSMSETGNPLDLAVEGDGFFEITMPDGTLAYTRDGSFKINKAGEVVTTDGYKVSGIDTIDQGTTEMTIAPDGSFSAIVNGSPVTKTRLTLVRFINPEGLRSLGKNLYKESEASGTPQTGQNPGENGIGTIAQRYLEASNVNAAGELVSMISTQRAYEATSKAIKASDEMMSQANSLSR